MAVVNEKKPCRLCKETGGKCPKCDGNGRSQWTFTMTGGKRKTLGAGENETCTMCGGHGRCPACGGTGWT
jgi:hypothetical protein